MNRSGRQFIRRRDGAQRSRPNQAALRRPRGRLRVNEPGDRFEQEADRAASLATTSRSPGDVTSAPLGVQRHASGAGAVTRSAPASVDTVVASAGAPLASSFQQDFGQRFAHDFSRVRIHTGSAAERSAREVNANAYTVGEHIVFGEGKFAPQSSDGRHLLAHELTHVVQQAGTGTSAGVLQRDHTRGSGDPWDALGDDAWFAAEELWERSEWLMYELGLAQQAGFSSYRADWRKRISTILQPRIHALNKDEAVEGAEEDFSRFERWIATNVNKSSLEWGKLEERVVSEIESLERRKEVDSRETAKALREEYDPTKQRLDKGAMAWITTEDYASVKKMFESRYYIDLGLLRGARKRAKNLTDMLRIVEELKREGEDAAKYVPGWLEATQAEIDHLQTLIDAKIVRGGTEYSKEFKQLQEDLTTRFGDAKRAKKPEKSTLEKGVDLVSGVVHAVADPFIEAAHQVMDLTKILLHFASFGKYEPKLSSDMAKAAEQGATTTELLKGMVTGIIEAPERLYKAIEAGDWEAIGREAVNLYMIAKSAKQVPDLLRHAPAAAVRMQRALRVLKARTLAVQLHEARMLPQAVTKAPAARVPGPEIYKSSPKTEPTILKDPPVRDLPVKDKPAAKAKTEEPGHDVVGADTGGKGSPKKGKDKPGQQMVSAGADKIKNKSSAKPDVGESAKTGAGEKASPETKGDTRTKGKEKVKEEAKVKEKPKVKDEAKAKDKAAEENTGKPAENTVTTGPDTVPPRQLRKELREKLEDRVKAKEKRLSDLRAERTVHDKRLAEIVDELKNSKSTAETTKLLRERAKVLEKQQAIGVLDDLGLQVAEARRLLRGTELDYFNSLTRAAAAKPGYQGVKAGGIDEVFGRKGPLEVEHVYPRSKIFSHPEFARLSWEDQVSIFNFRKNLKSMNGDMNRLRGNMTYEAWIRKLGDKIPENVRKTLDDLAKHEKKMQIDIDKMIRNPSTIPRGE